MRIFSFLPPIASYVFAGAIVACTFYYQAEVTAADPTADVSRIWLIGGILAFLLGFGGFQKSLERRGEKLQPSVNSMDVLAKLNVKVTDEPVPEPEIVPTPDQWLDADSPLGRLRAKSNPNGQL